MNTCSWHHDLGFVSLITGEGENICMFRAGCCYRRASWADQLRERDNRLQGRCWLNVEDVTAVIVGIFAWILLWLDVAAGVQACPECLLLNLSDCKALRREMECHHGWLTGNFSQGRSLALEVNIDFLHVLRQVIDTCMVLCSYGLQFYCASAIRRTSSNDQEHINNPSLRMLLITYYYSYCMTLPEKLCLEVFSLHKCAVS